ncbi:MAG TPA: hydrogen peroxide-inducible genes activator [Chitinophagaceae bacterium]|nr:hydrogen peroxide-inducible genes activator [Chitinophagaceae bacterium]
MNLQHLKYILEVESERHFARAAEKCFVTQPTLSMMIQKLEEELDIKIFDRSKQPVIPTEAGEAIIKQAKIILQEAAKLKDIADNIKGEIKGEIKLGIIPTVAPYLLPLFLSSFLKKYPLLKLKITELTTEQITGKLKNHQLDAGILATPLNNDALKEQPVYYEQFVVYASGNEKLMKKKYLMPNDIDSDHLWLLEEGHCLRSQILNLCELRKKSLGTGNLEYEAGSIETLKKMVDMNKGITILPELALKELTAHDKKHVRYFKPPVPVREISIVTYRHFVKQRIIDILKNEIIESVPKEMTLAKRKLITKIS